MQLKLVEQPDEMRCGKLIAEIHGMGIGVYIYIYVYSVHCWVTQKV